MPDLTPITREEKFLNGDVDLTPITREEMILAGQDLDVINRREWFLKKYRGSGGEIVLEDITITENGEVTAPSGKAYKKITTNVPLPQNAYLLKSATSYPIAPSLLPLPKAEVTFEGNKAELYVGSEPIVVDTDNKPYVYRQSPQNKSAVDLSLVGGTVAWNQLVQSTDTSCTVPNNHKYIFHHGTTYDVAISDGNAFTVDGSANDNVHDITQSFGSTIADYIYSLEQATSGSGIAWLKSYGFLQKDYYAYNSGELISVSTSAHKFNGINLWDGAYLNGAYSATGSFTQSDYYVSSKNKIDVKPNMEIVVIRPIACPLYVCEYGIDGSFLRRNAFSPSVKTTVATISGDTYKIHFSIGGSGVQCGCEFSFFCYGICSICCTNNLST